MKKNLLLLVLFFLLCFISGNAQLSEDFENGIPSTWTTFKTLNGALTTAPPVPGWTTSTQATNVCNGTTSAFISAQNIGAGNTSEGWLVTEQILVPTNGLLQFTSKRSATQVYPTRYIVKVSTTSQTDIASFTDTILDYGQTDIASAPNNCVEHGITSQIDLHDYAGLNIYIAFIKRDTQPAGINIPNNDRWILDDVKVVEECMAPTNVQSVPGINTANVTWTANGSTQWEVAVLQGAGMPNDNIADYTVTTNSAVLQGLTSLTTYTYYVRAICSDSNSAWVGPFTVTTLRDYCAGDHFYDSGGPTGDYSNNANQTTVICNPGGLVMVTFNSFNTESGYDFLRIYNGPTASSPLVGTYSGTTIPPSFTSTGSCLTFVFTSDGSVVRPGWDASITCISLSCPPPTNLQASIPQNSSTVDLSWIPGGSETQWEVIIQDAVLGAPTPSSSGTIVNQPSYSAPINEGQLLEYYVRAICDSDDKSYWAGPIGFSIFNPPGCASVEIEGVGIDIVDDSITVCPGEDIEDVTLNASFYGVASTTSYTVTPIGYAPPFPFTGGTEMNVNEDDRWSPQVPLPFDVCFFGNVYNRAYVSTNGVVSFNPQTAGSFSSYTVPTNTLPSTSIHLNSIMLFQDIDLRYNSPHASINYQVLGTYPCRALVVNYKDVPYYNSPSGQYPEARLTTFQIVIYEISNIIEIYVKNKPNPNTWMSSPINGGRAVMGIQNAAGNLGYSPPGRNTGVWAASNEAWRFTPSGASDVDFQWLLDGEFFSNDQEITVTLTPEQELELQNNGTLTLEFLAEATYDTCSDEIVTTRTVELNYTYSFEYTDPDDLTECSTLPTEEFDLTHNTSVILGGVGNPDMFDVTYYTSEADAESGDISLAIPTPELYQGVDEQYIWVRISNDVNDCYTIKSFQLFITEYVAPVIDFEYDSVSYCLGGSSPVITLGSGFTHIGEFSSTPSGLVLDATTGVITLSGSLPGTYTITYTVGSNACDTGLTHSEEVTLLESGVVDLGFSYDALEYCTNASDPVITLSGGFTGNGLFSATPSGLSIDATSGAIDLSASQAGAYEVVYTVNDVQCLGTVVSSPVSVTVHFSGTPNASFEYDSTSYCIAGANPVLNPSFTGGGEFSVSPSGLTIDSITGAIDLSTSTVGTYTITYEILPNGCNTGGSATYVITVTDLVAPQVNFSYVTSCVNSAVNPQVVTSGLTSGGLFSSTTLTVNPQTGEIDLSGATSGTHYVTYEVGVNGVTCTAYGTYTASIELTTELVPEVGFNYNSSYCYSDGSVLPDVALGFYYGGEFSSTGGLVINAQTGEINTGSSTPGTYVVTYTVLEDMSICNVGGSSQYTITIHGEFAVAISDECIGNVYWLHASAVNGSFDASTSTYTWVVNGNAVGYDSSFNVTEYLNGELLPSGGISVGVVVNNGCEGYAGFQVVSSSCITQKGISPNGDGQNDYFDLTGMGVRKLSIYNRYGREVYSRSNYEREWGGQDKNGNELPDGTYYYSIDKNDGTSSTGWIYINREY